MFNNRRSPVVGQTRRLDFEEKPRETAVPQIKPVDMGMPRPWRIALTLVDMQIQLVFDLTHRMMVGRAQPDADVFPDVDLTPFNAEDSGVSRHHMDIMMDADRVVVVDNQSANGTFVNGQRLQVQQPFPIRNGDELELGMMKLKVELLMNPFETF